MAVATFAALALLATVEAVLASLFMSRSRRAGSTTNGKRACPKVMAILCLRGADPFLGDCLRGLLTQDYPDYTVRIVVDHRDDPAHVIVDDMLRGNATVPVEVQTLAEPRPHCSLKCASQIQALSDLDPSYRVVVFIDADTVPDNTWMRELVGPLDDSGVGAATGNRWYWPTHPTWGAMARYAWNAAATVQMYWYSIAWGGSLAISVDALDAAKLRERWQQAFGEDTSLPEALEQAGLRIAFVPSLVMVNRESCDVGGFLRWAARQLVSVRLHHPRWLAVLAQGALATLLPIAALLTAAVLGARGQWAAASWPVAGLVVYEMTLLVLLTRLERTMRDLVPPEQDRPRLSLAALARYPASIALAQGLYAIALGRALLARSIEWRGIRYEILGRGAIRLVRYHPFRTESVEARPSDSL